MKLTKAQQQAVLRKYNQSQNGAGSYLQFRRQVCPVIGLQGVACLPWCGMFLVIEPDGHTRS